MHSVKYAVEVCSKELSVHPIGRDVSIRTKDHSSRSGIPAPGRDTQHSTLCRPELAWERRPQPRPPLQNTKVQNPSSVPTRA
ncbi:hypothetical protein L798_11526 [Zootermopsis nevadensis]|uniref:Uncharacterized protein n=1 Tax=Zootermopsis nevadensis TaxID=136037 RepID=A0A067QZ25_ZOONE|nr:hypothetical protein L798_11526 [Zootermopsis nevadensis]